MRIYTFIFLFFLLIPQSRALQVAVSPLIFKADASAYVELNYQIIGNSIVFDSTHQEGLTASVDVTVLFKQEDQIVDFDKYRLTSPVFKIPKDFIDIRRYPIAAGTYTLELEFIDVRDATNTFSFNEKIHVPDFTVPKARFSSLKLLANLEKADESSDMQWVQHGLVMEPLPHHFYDTRLDQISFYVELYDAGIIEQSPLLLKMEILNKQKGKWKAVQVAYQKLDSYEEVEAIARKMDLRKLASDYYKLKISLIDSKKKEYLRREALFARSNPNRDQKLKADLLANKSNNFFNEMTSDELEYALRAIAPIAPYTDQERINFLLAQGSPQMLKDYLYGYWVDEDPVQPKQAYDEYMALARALDEKYYSAFGYGFETDRGRIYLKYGPPTQIVQRENDHAAKPYEIWTYDRIDLYNQTNVKFVFYNPSLAGNNFELLHSNCRNEIQNPKWLQYIYDGPNEYEGNPVDGTGVKDNFARDAERLYNDN